MSKQLKNYYVLKEELIQLRNSSKEDIILEKMDDVWESLTEEEKQQIDTKWDSCGGSLNYLSKRISKWSVSKGWETNWRNVPEKLMLVVTELAEAMEEYGHIDHLSMAKIDGIAGGKPSEESAKRVEAFRVEIADAVIRLLNLSASLGIDIEAEIAAKMEKNEKRPFKHGGKNC